MTNLSESAERLQVESAESGRRRRRRLRLASSSLEAKSTMKVKLIQVSMNKLPVGSSSCNSINMLNGFNGEDEQEVVEEEEATLKMTATNQDATTTTTTTTTSGRFKQQRRQSVASNLTLLANIKRKNLHENKPSLLMNGRMVLLALIGALIGLCLASFNGQAVLSADARVTFEKMTNRDYSGLTYYTIQNVSLFECLGWCKEETSCTSAVFSFVVNPFAALQETTCMLQNETVARQTAYLRMGNNGDQVTVVAHPQKATNLYFFNKIELPTEGVCSRLWAFERFPNRKLRQRNRQPFHAPNKEACQAACMNEHSGGFLCRSLEYNYINQQCTLNGYDRRSPLILHLAAQASIASQAAAQISGQGGHHMSPNNNDLVEAPGTDYFENACLLGEDICSESRIYDYAKIGLPQHRTAHFVELNYYPDKEMLVKSQAGCVRACTIEHEFICRSILFRSQYKQGQPNCALYHLDQKTFPDGAETFMSHVMQPLLDSGETSAVYLEAICNDTINGSAAGSTSNSMTGPPSGFTITPSVTTPGGFSLQTTGSTSIHTHNNNNNNNSHSNDLDRFVSSSSTLSPLGTLATSASSTTIRLPTTFLPPFGNPSSSSSSSANPNVPNNILLPDILPSGVGSNGRPISGHFTLGPPRQPGGAPDRIVLNPGQPPSRDNGGLIIEPVGSSSSSSLIAGGNGSPNHDQNCDAHGFCYDVGLKCTDTKMVVNVKTQRPFFGRIYALGRSETCNANIKNQNQFQLDMYLTGQECNTQSAHHNVVLTKADKVYHVRCTYETASRNVSFGMMPVKDMFEVDVDDRNRETISITASSDAPLPKISILTSDGKEASTVRIGDRLTFRIEIPDNTPYGIFARSCIAMAKDARSTFEIIDDAGCPVDHTIFPNFLPISNGNALESNYEAFRFTESYGVIFQCNVKYCIGKCAPVDCGIGRDSVQAWGRKKRSVANGKQLGDDMTLSREIVVLDLKEKDPAGDLAQADSGGSSSALTEADFSKQSQPLTSSLDGSASSNDYTSSTNPQSTSRATTTSGATIYGDGSPKHCVSSQYLFVLICSIGLCFVLYVCVVAYFFARRDPKISPIKHQYH